MGEIGNAHPKFSSIPNCVVHPLEVWKCLPPVKTRLLVQGFEEGGCEADLAPDRRAARQPGLPVREIAAEFRLIEDFQVPVVVPWRGESGDDDTAERLLHDLAYVRRPGPIARRLQPYVVQIPPYSRSALLTAGAVSVIREEEFGQQFVVLENLDLYRADIGLSMADPTYRRTEGLVW